MGANNMDKAMGRLLAEKTRLPSPIGDWTMLLAALREAGFVVRPSGEETLDSSTFSRMEEQSRAILAEMAPPGTHVTIELIDQVKARVANMIYGELVAAGISENMARMLQGFLTVAINVKKKDT